MLIENTVWTKNASGNSEFNLKGSETSVERDLDVLPCVSNCFQYLCLRAGILLNDIMQSPSKSVYVQ